MTSETIERQVAERMKDLLTPPPASIKLSELVEAYLEQLRDKESFGVCYSDSATFRIDRDQGDFVYVGLDPKANKDRYGCEIRLGIHKGELFSLSFKNADVQANMFAGPFLRFERMVFQMKAAKTKIEIDVEPGDVSLCYGHGED